MSVYVGKSRIFFTFQKTSEFLFGVNKERKKIRMAGTMNFMGVVGQQEPHIYRMLKPNNLNLSNTNVRMSGYRIEKSWPNNETIRIIRGFINCVPQTNRFGLSTEFFTLILSPNNHLSTLSENLGMRALAFDCVEIVDNAYLEVSLFDEEMRPIQFALPDLNRISITFTPN